MRAATSTRTITSSAGESAAARVRRHNNWVTSRVRTGYADIETLAAERADVRQHVGDINKQLIHGDPLGRKPEYVARIAFENPNGLSPWNTEKAKPYRTARFVRRTTSDAYFGAEGNTNWDLVSYESQFANLFQNSHGMKAVAAHNVHDSSGKYQPGEHLDLLWTFSPNKSTTLERTQRGLVDGVG